MAFARRVRLRRVQVEGTSMAPALVPGDRLLVVPLWRPRVGDIVAVPDPRDSRRLLVKRVVAADRRRRTLRVEGDNRTASTDSRTFGPVSCDEVLGRAVYRYFPSWRAGRVHRAGRTVGRPR